MFSTRLPEIFKIFIIRVSALSETNGCLRGCTNPSLGAKLSLISGRRWVTILTLTDWLPVNGYSVRRNDWRAERSCQTERFIRFSKKCLPCTLTLRIPESKSRKNSFILLSGWWGTRIHEPALSKCLECGRDRYLQSSIQTYPDTL